MLIKFNLIHMTLCSVQSEITISAHMLLFVKSSYGTEPRWSKRKNVKNAKQTKK